MSRSIRYSLSVIGVTLLCCLLLSPNLDAQKQNQHESAKRPKVEDAKNQNTGKPAPEKDPEFARYAIFADSAPRAKTVTPVETNLPLALKKEARIAFIGGAIGLKCISH